jgi:hypothetical protein
VYTFRLEIHRNNRIPKDIIVLGEEVGYKDQNISARISLRVGAK